jgi:hypothetical protein
MRQAGGVVAERRVALHDDDDAGESFAPCDGKALPQPVDDGRVAGDELGGWLEAQTEVVVRPGNVERDEEHRAEPPAQMFRVVAGLPLERQ